MLKKGFTLQELLITMGIIGVVAALTAPSIIGIFPDSKKSSYLKAYNTLTNITNEILDDPTLYWTTYNNLGEPNCSGLYCRQAPSTALYPDCNNAWLCQNAYKFGAIFATKVNYTTRNRNNNIINVTTNDGVSWTFTPNEYADANLLGNNGQRVDITIDVDANSNRNSCTYANNCTNPERFSFRIENDGTISATDALGEAYLQDQTNLNNTAANKASAAQIYRAKY